jgi:hypothetical protein
MVPLIGFGTLRGEIREDLGSDRRFAAHSSTKDPPRSLARRVPRSPFPAGASLTQPEADSSASPLTRPKQASFVPRI